VKLVLIGITAFLVSLAASTTVVIMMRPAEEAVATAAANAVADSATSHDSTRVQAHPTPDTTELANTPTEAALEAHASETSVVAEPTHVVAQPRVDPPHEEEMGEPVPEETTIAAPIANVAQPQPEDDGANADSVAAAAREASARQLARVFSSMRAQDAAAVLKHMSDDEVIDVVRFLNSRTAAQVLSALDDARAAELSRKILNGRIEN
jgi:hypothetical protein